MDNLELDTFLQKFKQLWYSGLDANLDLHAHAGQAWVGLRVRLGHAPGPLHQPPNFPEQRKARNGPSRQRRRARREVSRQELAAQAGNVNDSKDVVDDVLEKATSDNDTELNEDLNDNLEKETLRNETGLSEDLNVNNPVENTVQQMEVVTNIAVDSVKEPSVNSDDREAPTYCKLCKECWEDIETAEDLSYHIMNNHEPQKVFENYGQKWIEERRHCVRKMSPFIPWFSNPLK